MKPNTPTPRLSNSLVFLFKDDFWFSKVFIGGLVLLLSGAVVGIFLVLGYLTELTNGILHDNEIPPEWRHGKRFFSHGIRLVLALAAYAAPLTVVNVLSHSASLLTVSIVLFLVAAPVIEAQYSIRFSLRDCFDWKSINRFIVRDPALFARGIFISYGTIVLSISFGWMTLIIGWPFVIFWATLVQAHIFATLEKNAGFKIHD
ncbi:MAG: DUF4013 domain-containing protein [Bacteroidota bacterium]|nr:DUF4013 domain-containing protein [Bacteroidota bacterium]